MNAPVQAGSASGAAKWAAVVLLSAGAGGGMVYSLATRAGPATSPPIVTPAQSPAPTPVAPSPPVIVQVMPAVPAATPPPAPQVSPPPASTPQASPPAADPAPAATPPPQPAAVQPPPAPQPAPPSTPKPDLAPPTAARKININTAGQSELELLPSVGPALAKRILEFREKNGPFKTTKDLDAVKGIGEKTLAKLLPLITVEPEKKPR